MVATEALAVAVVATLVLVAGCHRWLAPYPERLPCAETPRRELLEVGVLVGLNLALAVYAALAYRGLAPHPAFVALDGRSINPAVVAAGPLVAVGMPLALETGVHGRSPSSLGFRRPVALLPTVLLVGVGIGQGLSALGADPVAPVVLLLGMYNPAFEEEFLVHGVLQTKLERATDQVPAWIASGLLFGLLHLPNDFVGVFWLATGGDPLAATLVLARQTAFGLLAGVVYAKTRSLLAPVVAHYAGNALGPLLATLGA